MNWKKLITAAFLAAVTVSLVPAQSTYDSDALGFSMIEYGSTARGIGLAGAYSTIGGDFSSVSINPAGIGLYRKSELTITPSLYFVNTKSTYRDSTATDNFASVALNNLGYVEARELKDSDFEYLAYSIGYNRLANYNGETFFYSANPFNSITDIYVREANSSGGVPNDVNQYSFETVNAYYAWLVNANDSTGTSYSTPVDGLIDQEGKIKTKGGYDEVSFALAANYDDKFYIGANIGVPFINYERTIRFSEEDKLDTIDYFQSLEQYQFYETNGIGFKAGLGFIYKPVKWLRVGGSIQSPLFTSFTETYSSTIEHVLDGDSLTYEEESQIGTFDYTLRLPWRANLGASVFFGKYGFFSLDYEFVDYSSMNYDFGSGSEKFSAVVNEAMGSKYGPAHNIRMGLELAYEQFGARFGYAHYASPFREGVAEEGGDLSKNVYSAGLGYKDGPVFVHLTYSRSVSNQFYLPYSSGDQYEAGVTTKNSRDNIVITLGYQFER